MKRTLIGAVLLIAGVLQNIGIIISATISIPHFSSWSTTYPSRLWFLIFAGKSKYQSGADGLSLGILFIFGIIMIVSGLLILLIEYKNN